MMLIQIDPSLENPTKFSKALYPWLIHQHSLTEKLKTESGEAKLTLLSQAWTKPNWWERYVLGLNEEVMHREIIMSSRQHPCWYARTIIPQSSYNHAPTFWESLGDQPLGNLIFNNPKIERTQILNYQIDKNCLEYHWLPTFLADEAETLDLRGSVLSLDKQASFCLVEILLPGLLKATAKTKGVYSKIRTPLKAS